MLEDSYRLPLFLPLSLSRFVLEIKYSGVAIIPIKYFVDSYYTNFLIIFNISL